ncbi:MAG: hypothetical protein ACOH2H_19625 [Cypionkella sp.]
MTGTAMECRKSAGLLFAELISVFFLKINHASYARFEDRPFGECDVWMNVINVDADHGRTEQALFAAFYGERAD